MAVVLRLWSVIGIPPVPLSDDDKIQMAEGLARGEMILGEYVEDCDLDTNDGDGEFKFTPDKSRAKRFDNVVDAMEYWKRQSTIKTLRTDGRPNRPLTAFNVTPEEV